MNQRVNGWLVVVCSALIATMLLLNLAAYAYRLQESRREAQLVRAYHEQKEAQRREEASHIYRVGRPYYFVGRDGCMYAYIDDTPASTVFLSTFGASVSFTRR